MTTDEFGKPLVFDAWNRLVQVKNSGGTPIATYKYDALNRRIVETVSGNTRDIFFSAAWRVLEEREGSTAKVQYVWSPVYVDALILRDRDADGNPGNGMEERLYVQQDANANVTALISISGSVVERFVYDPYGQATFLNSSWTILSGSAYAWVVLHQGGFYDPATGLNYFRNRFYSSSLGRWVQLDPIGFVAGDANLYRYVHNNPANATDPTGLLEWTHVGPVFGRPGLIHVYVVREWLFGFNDEATRRWVGYFDPATGTVERGNRRATRGAVETAGYQSNWDAWFEEYGHEICPAAPAETRNITGNADSYRALDPNFDQRGPQARGMVIGLGVTVLITGLSGPVARITTRAIGAIAQRAVIAAVVRAETALGRAVIQQGSLQLARQAAEQGGEFATRGLFRFDGRAIRVTVTRQGRCQELVYAQHHLWPRAMGGPTEGWVVYALQPHNANNAIHGRLNTFLRQRTGLQQRPLEEWARGNTDALLPMLREFYEGEGIQFPY